jgi:hypothetical protein
MKDNMIAKFLEKKSEMYPKMLADEQEMRSNNEKKPDTHSVKQH